MFDWQIRNFMNSTIWIVTDRTDFFNNSIIRVLVSEELYGPAVRALRRAIAEVKQRWSVIGWVTKNLLSRAPPCFGRHVKPLVPAAFAVVSTHKRALGPRGGLLPVLLMCWIFWIFIKGDLTVINLHFAPKLEPDHKIFFDK
jgi:hypothetical protein